MDLIRFYLRKLFSLLKGEVFVLPSRIIVFIFCLTLLLLPLLTQDPYLLRIDVVGPAVADFETAFARAGLGEAAA